VFTSCLIVRAVTAMSPLQDQEWLCLNEARRLMLTEHVDASITAFHVGYESSSQFSREFKRFFGQSPAEMMRELRVDDEGYLVRI
jgi:AraC-like DNA-binding protein